MLPNFSTLSRAIIPLVLPLAVAARVPVGPATPHSPAAPSATSQAAANPTECFIENRGQWDSQAKFLAQSNGIDSWVTQDGVVYDFHKFVPDAKQAPSRGKSPPRGIRYGHVVKMSFAGSQPGNMLPSSELNGSLNYFIGNDRGKWAKNVGRFSEVESHQVYKGISARYYFEDGAPRYDLVVAPGADTSQIQIKFEGADSLDVSPSGALRVGTLLGTVEERGLFVYQGNKEVGKQVDCQMITDGQSVKFRVGSYDHSKPLVIDPLIFSTYLGGSGSNGSDGVQSEALDSTGNIIVAGETASTNFPTTLGAYQTSNNNPFTSVFIAKLNPQGTALIFSTYLGGNGALNSGDYPTGMTIDRADNVYVVGSTGSPDFPTTSGAYSTSGGAGASFITKLIPGGTALIFSTFFGQSDNGVTLNAVALDASNNVAVSGFVYPKPDAPITGGTFQTSSSSSLFTGIVAELSSSGASLVWGSYLGGSTADSCNALALDSQGRYVVAGVTASGDFPLTANAFQSSKGNPNGTGFIARLSSNGTALVASSFLGGSGALGGDTCQALALDPGDNAVVAGETGSTDFPVTAGAFQTTNASSSGTGFVAKMSEDETALAFATYLGGGTQTSVLVVTPATVASLTAAPNSVIGGQGFGMTVALTGPAGPAGDVVTISAGDSAAVTVPATELIPPHASSAVFTIKSNAVSATTAVTLTATFNSVSKTATVTVNLPGMSSFSLVPASVVGGASTNATMSISGYAGPTGDVVDLTSNNSNVLIPASVTVLSGKSSVTFSIPTKAVSASAAATLTATIGSSSKTATLALTLPPIAALNVPASVVGGASSSGSVTLSGPAGSSGDVVELTSSNAAVKIPGSVKVAPNGSSGAIPIGTAKVTSTTIVTITATLGKTTMSKTVTLMP